LIESLHFEAETLAGFFKPTKPVWRSCYAKLLLLAEIMLHL